MHEETRRRLAYEVQQRKSQGASERAIARELGIHRQTVRRLLQELEARREAGESALVREVGPPAVPRSSKLDPFLARIESWLNIYEDLTAVRLLEKLREEGFTGSYTIVREHLKKLRGRRVPQEDYEVIETPAGQQAQFDWSPFVLPGCAVKVQVWGCSLSYSRARSFEAWDNSRQNTIIACLRRSFETFGGVPDQCVTDSMPGVVDRWECNQPILNVRFVDFAAYYNFSMDIAPRAYGQYKGKKERTFRYLNENLFNGRKFSSLEEFREVLAWWIPTHAMQQKHPRTQRLIEQMLEEERPSLKPLPARPYDTRDVCIRMVDPYGLVQYQTNYYPVPGNHAGEMVYVCADHQRLEVLDRRAHRLAEHQRHPDGAGVKPAAPDPHRRRLDITLLLEKLISWGEIAHVFARRLQQKKRSPALELDYILGLQMRWSADDIVRALSHAMNYDAYDARAVERILEARFKPRTLQAQIADSTRARIRELMRDSPVQQRSLTDYPSLRSDVPPTLPHAEDSNAAPPDQTITASDSQEASEAVNPDCNPQQRNDSPADPDTSS
jgi:transposase